MGWFGGYDVSEDMQSWISDSYHWAIDNKILTADTQLVLANKEFFPAARGNTTEDTVRGLVENLKVLMGLDEARIELMPIEVLPDELRHQYGMTSEIAGTWQADENASLIRYDRR